MSAFVGARAARSRTVRTAMASDRDTRFRTTCPCPSCGLHRHAGPAEVRFCAGVDYIPNPADGEKGTAANGRWEFDLAGSEVRLPPPPQEDPWVTSSKA